MHTILERDVHHTLEIERPRLVRLCAFLLGDADTAEDAAQEVLIEAWRHIDQLREPSAIRAWLSGIAHNVCARLLRTHGRQSLALTSASELAVDQNSAFDLEIELERHELATLLDRALALLPESTRAVLIQKYVADLSHAAIAERLGLSENVVAVRLHRGKLALRNVLTNQLQAELEPFGLLASDDGWQETRIWCSSCGKQLLRGKFTDNEFVLRCPACCIEPDSFHSQSTGGMKLFAGVKGFRPALNRFSAWMHDYFQTALVERAIPCRVCGQPMPLRLCFPDYAPPSVRAQRGLHVYCARCGVGSYESLNGLALGLPQGRRFFQNHKRIRALPEHEVTFNGAPALVVAFESVTGEAAFHAVLDQATYTVLALGGGRND